MTDNELLLAISDLLDKKLDMKLQPFEKKFNQMEEDMSELKRRITNIELHIENVTDKNIQLIAENFIELTKKLNEVIPAANNNLMYEVKVNYLVEKVQALEKEVAELKNKIA